MCQISQFSVLGGLEPATGIAGAALISIRSSSEVELCWRGWLRDAHILGSLMLKVHSTKMRSPQLLAMSVHVLSEMVDVGHMLAICQLSVCLCWPYVSHVVNVRTSCGALQSPASAQCPLISSTSSNITTALLMNQSTAGK